MEASQLSIGGRCFLSSEDLEKQDFNPSSFSGSSVTKFHTCFSCENIHTDRNIQDETEMYRTPVWKPQLQASVQIIHDSQFPYISCICPNKLNQFPAVNVYVYVSVCLYTCIIILVKVIISMVEEPDMFNNYKHHICSEKETQI